MSQLPDLFRDFERPFSSMGSWRPLLRQFDDLLTDNASSRLERSFTPACDIEEDEHSFILNFDIPGIDRQHIDIELNGNNLVVSGERKNERKEGQGRKHFTERTYGKFVRSVTLPTGVAAEQIEASHKDGVLTIHVPKAADAKTRKIKIEDRKWASEDKVKAH